MYAVRGHHGQVHFAERLLKWPETRTRVYRGQSLARPACGVGLRTWIYTTDILDATISGRPMPRITCCRCRARLRLIIDDLGRALGEDD